MIHSVIKISVAILLLSNLSEQSSNPGPCSTLPPQLSFTPESLSLKIWHLIATDDEGLPYHNLDCIRFVHSTIPGSGNVETVETAKDLPTNKREVSISSMKFSDAVGSYVYETDGVPSQDTKIILSDGQTYYVEVSCVDVGGEAIYYVGIFSTAPVMDSSKLKAIYSYLEAYNFKRSNFRTVEQSPYICGL